MLLPELIGRCSCASQTAISAVRIKSVVGVMDVCEADDEEKTIELKIMTFRVRPSGTLDSSPAIYCRVGMKEPPVPAGRLKLLILLPFKRPAGTRWSCASFPAMNRWATVGCPSGTVSEILFLKNYRTSFLSIDTLRN